MAFDVMALTNFFDFLVRPGFQYRRFIRIRWAYHIWERFLRHMAGIGSLPDINNAPRAKRMQATPEILIVGGGTAGLSAALHAAQAGSKVLLVEREKMLGGRGLYDTSLIETPEDQTSEYRSAYTEKLAKKMEEMTNGSVLKGATAFAWYDEGILAVSRPYEFWELRPVRVIIATGSYENPMVFENNDLPGIFLSTGLQRLMHRFYIRPGNQAVVAACNNNGYVISQQLIDAGVASGGQGVNRAWLEGKVAGLSAALDSGHGGKETEGERDHAMALVAS